MSILQIQWNINTKVYFTLVVYEKVKKTFNWSTLQDLLIVNDQNKMGERRRFCKSSKKYFYSWPDRDVKNKKNIFVDITVPSPSIHFILFYIYFIANSLLISKNMRVVYVWRSVSSLGHLSKKIEKFFIFFWRKLTMTFCMADFWGLRNMCHIATMATPPLIMNHFWKKIETFFKFLKILPSSQIRPSSIQIMHIFGISEQCATRKSTNIYNLVDQPKILNSTMKIFNLQVWCASGRSQNLLY
jgi:hypothetical protein